uniref:Uncharacterized protein n=1 Tax=Myoviridae sp. ctqfO1 TaxID=2827710 RepID=A0A8S5T344_9CAUD|nr:MAG TPA: hypothetical protein [Myoviridae sp. ctqfO1]
MAYDYTKDPAWIEFESKDREDRRRKEEENREYTFLPSSSGIGLTGALYQGIEFRGTVYHCSLAKLDNYCELMFFKCKKNGKIDYANPVFHKYVDFQNMGVLVDHIHAFFRGLQSGNHIYGTC